jgi:hypothetical protein
MKGEIRMSEARKCDRCHGYFELSAEDQKNRGYPYDMKGTYVKIMLFGRYGEVENSVRWYDLCPNCMELLDKWLENPDIDDTDCVDRSNGATEKELELASKLNNAKIYIAQLKNELGYAMTKEEIELMKGIHNFTDEDEKEDTWTDEDCDGIGCWECKYFRQDKNVHNPYDEKGAYYCSHKKLYISGNVSRPDYMDMRYTDFDKLGCKGEKKRWLENHKEETKLSDPYEEGGL